MRIRKGHAGAIARWCRDAGLACEITKNGKHPHARISYRGKSRKVYFAGTPSDRRGRLNTISTVRRSALELGWKPESEATR